VGAAGGGYLAVNNSTPAVSEPPAQVQPAPAMEPPASTVTLQPNKPEPAMEVPPPTPQVVPSPQKPAIVVKTPKVPPPSDPPLLTSKGPEEEVALMERAHRAMRGGDARSALTLVGEHEKVWADGLLVQEREVIAIEALVKLGRDAQARERAQRFHRKFPTSSHRLRVEAILERK
jgi:hypothetical protein